jgi:hypothetical protein
MRGAARRARVFITLFFLLSFALATAAPARGETSPPAEGQVMVTPPPPDGAEPGAPLPPFVPPPAPAPPPAPPPNPPAGYVEGTGFVIQSPDAAYRLRVGLTAAYKFEPVYQNGDWQSRNTFFVLRPSISGNFLREWIHFWTSLELAANPPYVLDSYLELFPWKGLGLRIGQQWTPFDRHEYFGPQEILFATWAPVSEYFWTGRDKGVTAMGVLADKLEYWAGVYSGTPLRQYNALPGNYVLQGRLTWSPLGLVGGTEFPYITSEGGAPLRVSATVQGYYGKVQLSQENFNPSTFTFQAMATGDTRKQGAGGADFWLSGRWFMLYIDAMIRHTEPPMGAASFTSVGVWGQLGVPIVAKTMDVAARVNWLNPSTTLGNDQFYSIEGQVAYYASRSQGLVIKLRYGYGHQDSPGMAALGAVPLVIANPGRTQIGTLQIHLSF